MKTYTGYFSLTKAMFHQLVTGQLKRCRLAADRLEELQHSQKKIKAEEKNYFCFSILA